MLIKRVLIILNLVAFIIVASLILNQSSWGSSFSKLNLFDSNQSRRVSSLLPSPVKRIANPVHLSIPQLNISAEIETVGKDDKGRMDVPKKYKNVGWYGLGRKPGELGSAVIAGHFDDPTGPSIFFNLSQLNLGDMVTVTTEDGEVLNFKVTDKQKYSNDNFPLDKVFASKDKTMLNLITCGGQFNWQSQSYSDRWVVYTELAS